MRTAYAIVLSLSLCSCAAVFRGSSDQVKIESTPAGAEATSGQTKIGATPVQFTVPRQGSTSITLVKQGYEDNIGTVEKGVNGAWVTLDVATCIIPVLLCIPLIIDAVTGAWIDVNERYAKEMKPGSSRILAEAAGLPVPGVTPATPAPTGSTGNSSAPAGGPPPNMSESERKATARAAFLEGTAAQDKNDCATALPKFETAQKFYPAPTHQLHIAECQAATGKLVEANETYESLSHTSLPAGSPDAFQQAQNDGKKEMAALAPRIPTLRISTTPGASGLKQLVVKLNGNAIPNEVLGIARPVNPGHYKVTAWAAGYKEAASEVDVVEGSPKAVELKMQK